MVGENALDFLGKLINFKVNITLDTIVAVFKMGIRKLLLGLDPKDLESQLGELKRKTDEIERLKAQIEVLKAQAEELSRLKGEVGNLKTELSKVRDEIQNLLKALNEKADKADIQDLRLRLNSLMKTLNSLTMKIDGLEIGLQGDHLLADDEAKKELIFRLIREGYNTPKELKAMVPFGNKKLYEVLRELEREGLIKKLKKRRKVIYVSEEGAY